MNPMSPVREPPRMEPLKERIAIKALHRSLRRSIGSCWLVSRPGRVLETHPVVRLVHLRLNLFAKLEYNNVVGNLKVDRADTG